MLRTLVVACTLLLGVSILVYTLYPKDKCTCIHASDDSVCGEDGLWYASACLAGCHGIPTTHPDHCSSSPVLSLDEDTPSRAQIFASNFDFIGVAQLAPQNLTAEHDAETIEEAPDVKNDSPTSFKTVRIARDGSVYVSKLMMDSPLLRKNDIVPSPSNEEEIDYDDSSRRRRMLIIGEDERAQVVSRDHADEYVRAIGQLTGCTGTLISRRHVLTSAHCFYSRQTQRYSQHGVFYQSRLGYSDYIFTSAVTHVDIPHEYITTINLTQGDYDVALVTLEEETAEFYSLPYRSSTCKETPEEGNNYIIAGYPSDKLWNTLWRSYCPTASDLCADTQIFHDCDTVAGMSGAPMIEFDVEDGYVIRAVHGAGRIAPNGEILLNRATNLLPAWQDWITSLLLLE